MRLLLDEGSGSHSLCNALRASGHDVLRVVETPELGNGATDESIFDYAVADARLLITKNGSDFVDIANGANARRHHGISLINYNQDGTTLPVASVVLAVTNISKTYASCDGLVLSVNQHVWRKNA